jgi:hypothetical protein
MRAVHLSPLLLAGLLVTGCGATVRTTTDAAVVTPTDAAVVTPADAAVVTPADAAVVTPTDVGAVTPADASFPGACREGDLCLAPRTPVAGLSVTSGRLAVVWNQINDDGPDPTPQVALDIPFAGSSSTVRVPFTAIAPPGDAVLFCARACDDEARCPCIGGPRLGFAYVVVAQDADANGRLDFGERPGVRADPIVAVGYVVVAQSPEAMAVASAPLDMLFTAGVARGVAPYLPLPRGSRHVLGAPEPTRIYDLNFCPPDNPACAPYLPDIN